MSVHRHPAALLLLAVLAAGTLAAESPAGLYTEPLEVFEPLIGNRWTSQGMVQVFEWGPGRMSVRSKSYLAAGDEPRLISEGHWFWHPGEEAIKGYFVAVDMPAVVFEYTTEAEGDRLVHDLLAYTPAGEEQRYVETWDLADGSYAWSLAAPTTEGLAEVMSGTWEGD